MCFSPDYSRATTVQHISTSMYVKKKYLYNPDEDFELIDMKCGPYASVSQVASKFIVAALPLLQSTKTQHSPANTDRQTNKCKRPACVDIHKAITVTATRK